MSAEWKRFLPVLAFIARFLGIYMAGNLLYGWMVESYAPHVDPITRSVAQHMVWVMGLIGFDVTPFETETVAQVDMLWNNHRALALFEGCNGINVMVVWLAFLVAIGPINRRMLLFTAGGLVVIHLMNLVRLILLMMVAEFWSNQFYLVHKYVFTASLYIVVFAGWWIWLRMRSAVLETNNSSES